jgi:hypothetical protein
MKPMVIMLMLMSSFAAFAATETGGTAMSAAASASEPSKPRMSPYAVAARQRALEEGDGPLRVSVMGTHRPHRPSTNTGQP